VIRLRQICLVAHERDTVVDDLCATFGLLVGYNDPHIHTLGLHNAVIPVGDQFLEVVAPITTGTTAERYLNKRAGEGGYMLIFQTDDFAAHRQRVDEMGIRVVADYSAPGYTDMQLHPADTGGTFVEIDQQDPPDAWHPAGPNWRDAVDTSLTVSLGQADVGCVDPEAVSARWGRLMDLPVTIGRNCGMHKVRPVDFCVRFTPAGPRGEGLDSVEINVHDADEVVRRASERGLPRGEGAVTIGGVRFIPKNI